MFPALSFFEKDILSVLLTKLKKNQKDTTGKAWVIIMAQMCNILYGLPCLKNWPQPLVLFGGDCGMFKSWSLAVECEFLWEKAGSRCLFFCLPCFLSPVCFLLCGNWLKLLMQAPVDTEPLNTAFLHQDSCADQASAQMASSLNCFLPSIW